VLVAPAGSYAGGLLKLTWRLIVVSLYAEKRRNIMIALGRVALEYLLAGLFRPSASTSLLALKPAVY
jgi:hypothetical protein